MYKSSIGAECAYEDCLELINSFYKVFENQLSPDAKYTLEAIMRQIANSIVTCKEALY